jgi:hypothetical protein
MADKVERAAAARKTQLERRALRELCPKLRRLLELELAAGNTVVAIKDDWGFVVLLGDPFTRNHEAEEREREDEERQGQPLTFREVNNRSEWKAEINAKEFNHTLACGFGAEWKPATKLVRNSALVTLLFVYFVWQLVSNCTQR